MPESFPLVSAVLLSCNSEKFIADAVRSAMAQDYAAMELIISDDASVDRTVLITQEEVDRYRGPHRIVQRQRSENSGGLSAHLNEVLQHVSGDIIVLFNDDDISEPSRVRKIVDEFRRDSAVSAVYSSYRRMNHAGRLLAPGRILHPPSRSNTKAWFARVDAHAPGATLAVHRNVVERFDPLNPAIPEDVVLPFRASLLGEVAYIDEDLVKVRRRVDSLSQSADTYASIERYRSRMLWGVEKTRLRMSQRLSDVQAAVDLMPHRAGEFERLRAVIYDSMSNAEISSGLFSPSIGNRLRAFVQLLRRGAYREYSAVNFCIAFMPRSYLLYRRLWLKRHVLGVGSMGNIG